MMEEESSKQQATTIPMIKTSLPLSPQKMGEEAEEEDYGALIYRESQLRKAEAAAAASVAKDAKKKKNSTTDASSSTRRQGASTRAASAAVRTQRAVNIARGKERLKRKRELSTEDNGVAEKRAQRSKYRYECSADGCTNRVIKGGVCIQHGAKRRLCSSEGCTNQVRKGGVCIKHGAKV